jgi:hypothetical protein
MNILLLSTFSNLIATAPILKCTSLHIQANPFLIASDGRLKSLRILEETEIKADSGQAENQFRVEQSTSEGNLRHLTLRAEPIKNMTI